MKTENTSSNFLILNDRQLCDLELILNGSFDPIKGFMNEDDYNTVVKNMHLNDGSLWPMPINLDVKEQFLKKIKGHSSLILKNKEGFSLAKLEISDIWQPNKQKEAQSVYGTVDNSHPGVNYLINESNNFYIGGIVKKISLPNHYDFLKYRLSPKMTKSFFLEHNWNKVIAFQTRNPLHKAHIEMTLRAAKDHSAKILIHPVVGLTKPGDVDYFTRVRCYEHALKKYPKNTAVLSLLPLAMRMAGPKEALWHALIRKNYGCSHIIIGRDHAGPGKNNKGNNFYGPLEAQQLISRYEDELGIKMVPFNLMVYVPHKKKYFAIDEIKKHTKFKTISGTQLRDLLTKDKKIPEWFTYKEISDELTKTIKPPHKQGFTIFFSGLSGSGKSTIANALVFRLLEIGNRSVTLLDGDIVRTNLSSELGFSKEHRSLNVRRIGYVASEITKNGGIAVCAPIAPYNIDRQFNRRLISSFGGYVEVYVNTPLKKM